MDTPSIEFQAFLTVIGQEAADETDLGQGRSRLRELRAQEGLKGLILDIEAQLGALERTLCNDVA